MKMIFIFILIIASLWEIKAETETVIAPFFKEASYLENNYLYIVIEYDAVNYTNTSISFANVNNCKFTNAGDNIFVLNQTWFDCFDKPIDSDGLVSNTIDIISYISLRSVVVQTFFTLFFYIQFQTTTVVASSVLTIISNSSASLLVYEYSLSNLEKITPTAVPNTNFQKSSGLLSVSYIAVVASIMILIFIITGFITYHKYIKKAQIAPSVV